MSTGTEIAIIGLSGQFPGAHNVSEFWRNLQAGVEAIKPDAIEDLSGKDDSLGHWVDINGLLHDVDLFDAPFFGFNPREAEMMDPQHRLFLEHAWQACEDAGYQVGDQQRPVGVFAGAALSAYVSGQFADDAHLLESLPAIIANDKDYLATRTSYKMNLSGPSMTVQCACSTSLVAIHLACQSLIAGECDAALAGGISISVPRVNRYFYLPGGLLSPDGRCRAFDARAKGTAFAEGAGIVLLMRLEDAIRDRYPIYAVILGSAVNNDASLKAGYTAPSIEGQIQVIQQAQAVAGIDPSTISYVEAHGTGTVLGDAVELAALTRVFRSTTRAVGFCGLGSVKTNIGHLATAAGVAGLIKTVLSLQHHVIPPSLNFEEPNPDLDLATSPFYINTTLRPWTHATSGHRRAGVSSFGIGGTNAHIILEEFPRVSAPLSHKPWHLVPISAHTQSALNNATANVADFVQTHAPAIADVAYTLQGGRRAFEQRQVTICTDGHDLLHAFETNPERILAGQAPTKPPLVAFMFPGQGAQYAGMGAELYRTEPIFRDHVDTCLAQLQADVAGPLAGLLGIHSNPPEQATIDIQQTALAQPALFVIEYALSKLLEVYGMRPAMMIGHSVGEYVAACLAEVVSLKDALYLVTVRGRMMQRMPEGSMFSVNVAAEDLLPLLPESTDIAALNAPTQCVVSGSPAAMEQLATILAEHNIVYRRLHTSHGFHSAMMDTMLMPFAQAINHITFQSPTIPYISNVSGLPISNEQVHDPLYWTNHIRHPVLFAQGIERMCDHGITCLIEVGPGKMLSTLTRQCGVETRGVRVIDTLPDARAPVTDSFWFTQALGKLWINGVDIAWDAVYHGEQRRHISLPTYPFERQRYWHEPRTTAPPPSLDQRMPMADWFYRPSWKRLEFTNHTHTDSYSCTLVLCDSLGWGPSLVDALQSQGVQAIAVMGAQDEDHQSASYTIDPAQPADYTRLFTQLKEARSVPDRIIHCWSLTTTTPLHVDESLFRDHQTIGLFSLLYLVQAFESVIGIAPLHIDMVTNGLFDVLGNEPLFPPNATMLSFSKVIPQEHQNIVCRVFDVMIAPDMYNDHRPWLCQLIQQEPTELVIALRHRHGWGQYYEPVVIDALHETLPNIKPQGVYLITGGLGQIGLALACHLAEQYQARIILTGRSPFPAKEQWYDQDQVDAKTQATLRMLHHMEQVGGEVWVKQANVSSVDDMEAVRAFIEDRYGQLDGLIFGAGLTRLQRGAFQDVSLQECEAHFESKVYGLIVVERIFKDMSLDFCMVLSSLSTILGGLGHLAYSAANQFADAFVHQHNRTSSDRWTTVDWDAWQFEQPQQAEIPTPTMTKLVMHPGEGSQAFDMVLRMPTADHLVISTGHLQSRVDAWVNLRSLRGDQMATEPSSEAKHIYTRPDLYTPYAEPEGDLEQRTATLWQQALGIDRIGRHDDFFELGGTSLLAIQILAHIRDLFGVDFPIDILFEATTVCKMAEVIDGLLQAKLEQLTEAEAVDLLERMAT